MVWRGIAVCILLGAAGASSSWAGYLNAGKCVAPPACSASCGPGTCQWTDGSRLPARAPVREVHFDELRCYIDCARQADSLAAYSWSGQSVGAASRAKDLNDMRAAISAVYPPSSPPAWTNPAPGAGSLIHVADVNDLRSAVENAPAAQSCAADGGACSSNADCCSGSYCVLNCGAGWRRCEPASYQCAPSTGWQGSPGTYPLSWCGGDSDTMFCAAGEELQISCFLYRCFPNPSCPASCTGLQWTHYGHVPPCTSNGNNPSYYDLRRAAGPSTCPPYVPMIGNGGCVPKPYCAGSGPGPAPTPTPTPGPGPTPPPPLPTPKPTPKPTPTPCAPKACSGCTPPCGSSCNGSDGCGNTCKVYGPSCPQRSCGRIASGTRCYKMVGYCGPPGWLGTSWITCTCNNGVLSCPACPAYQGEFLFMCSWCDMMGTVGGNGFPICQ